MTTTWDVELFGEAVDDFPVKEYHVSQEERDNAIKCARAAGFTVYQGSPTTLLLDFDEPYTLDKKYGNERVWEKLVEYVGVVDGSTRWWKSRGGNTHCKLTLAKPLSAETRIAWQAALGSDPLKEALSLARLLNGIEEPSMLFEPMP